MSQLIGVFGGTFDPVHCAHLQLAQQLLSELSLTELRLIPCYQPVHRDSPSASATDRLQMLRLAVAELNQPKLIVDDCEIRRHQPSYMVDTLTSLKQRHPHNSLVLVMGYDAWLDFLSWRDYAHILELAHLVLVSRPGFKLPTTGSLTDLLSQHSAQNSQLLHSQQAGRILVQPQFHLPESATEVRAALAKRHFQGISDSVADYIKKHHLYCN